jgi:hypothetical protein
MLFGFMLSTGTEWRRYEPSGSYTLYWPTDHTYPRILMGDGYHFCHGVDSDPVICESSTSGHEETLAATAELRRIVDDWVYFYDSGAFKRRNLETGQEELLAQLDIHGFAYGVWVVGDVAYFVFDTRVGRVVLPTSAS